MNDGRLGLLDFGCIRHYSPEELQMLSRWESYVDGRMTMEEQLIADGYATADVSNEDYMARIRRRHRWMSGPVLDEGAFDFGDEIFFKEDIDSLRELTRKIYPSLQVYLYIFRSLFGLRVLSYQLKCRVDIAALRRQERKPWV